MQCPSCHNEVAPQNSFCNHCGASLAGSGTSAPVPPATPPISQASSGGSGWSSVSSQPPQPGNPQPSAAYPPPPPPPAYQQPASYQQQPGYQQTPVGYPPPPAYAAPGATSMPGAGGLSENAAAAIAYITIIPAIVFLVVEPYNKIPLVRFHAFQSIGLFVVAVVVQVAVVFMQIFLHFIPLSWMLFALLHLVIFFGLFIGWLVAIFQASKGQWYKLPVIGDFAEKQARS